MNSDVAQRKLNLTQYGNKKYIFLFVYLVATMIIILYYYKFANLLKETIFLILAVTTC